MAMTSLPSFFTLQAYHPEGAYLSIPKSGLAPVVRFTEFKVLSPRAKFAAEKSKTGDASLVHIRSCFNNKYWVANEVAEGLFEILASANKPQEDTTDPGCTLFRVSSHTTVEGLPGFRLFSISTSFYASEYLNFGLSGSEKPYKNIFNAVNLETLVVLPDHPVAFRSEARDGSYLCSRVLDGHNYQRFESGVDIGDPEVAHEIIPNNNGTYCIYSVFFKRFWRATPNWIWADVEFWTNNTSYFSCYKISDKVIALRNLGNNKFCGPDSRNDRLTAEYSELSKETRLTIEERIQRKKISNVVYRVVDSMIYDKELQMVAYQIATNESPDIDATATIEASQTESITYTWNNSQSVSVGAAVSVGFEVDEVPLVAKSTLQVELSTEHGSSHEWGESKGKEFTTKGIYTISVPPLTTMKMSLMVSKGACDVPFNYTETVLLTSGEWVNKDRDDGIYSGINTLEFFMNSSKVDYTAGQGKVVVPGQKNKIVINQ